MASRPCRTSGRLVLTSDASQIENHMNSAALYTSAVLSALDGRISIQDATADLEQEFLHHVKKIDPRNGV